MKARLKSIGMLMAIVAVAAGGYYAWTRLKPGNLPDSIASGYGRIEADIDDMTLTSLRWRSSGPRSSHWS